MSQSKGEWNPPLGNHCNENKAVKCSIPPNCPIGANQEQASMLKCVPHVATGLLIIAPKQP